MNLVEEMENYKKVLKEGWDFGKGIYGGTKGK